MAKTNFKSVDAYIASQPEAVWGTLERVRNAILKAVSGVEETISYNIPTYKLNGSPVLYFAGWKQHYSLYPIGDRVVAAFRDDIAPYEIKKSTLRFPFSKPVPVELIARIAKFRSREIAERENAKASTPKKSRAVTSTRIRRRAAKRVAQM